LWTQKKDGTYTWGLVNAPFHRENGIVVGASVAAHDITERRAVEDALRKTTAKLEAALSSMTDAVFISDLDGNFVNFNEAFATFHKFKNKAECAKSLADYPHFLDVYLPGGDLAPLDQWAVPRALRGEAAMNSEYTLRRKDTGESWGRQLQLRPPPQRVRRHFSAPSWLLVTFPGARRPNARCGM